ncbi:MAG: hypothetical protein HZA78_11525 [Candidatus Schekmanbacteria bacterium]|nr:hypothetical protein [Candidatus Schekmanbacteria bacterium]
MKKHVGRALLCGIFLLSAINPTKARAGGWEEILQKLSPGNEIVDGTPVTASAYNGTLTFTITNVDGIANNFGDTDTVDLTLTGAGKTLVFSGSKTALVDWAKDNKDTLLTIVFGASPESSITGSTNTGYNIQQLFTNISPAPTASSSNSQMLFMPVTNKDIVVSGQYDYMTVGKNKDKANGSSGMFNYEHKFGEDSKHSLGIALPYRQLTVEDELESDFKYLSILPFYKFRAYGRKYLVEWIVNLTANATYIKSALFPDGGGYFEYGGGIGLKYSYAFDPRFSVSAGIMYQALKKEIPAGLVPEELQWVSEAINNLPVEQDLVPSLGFVGQIVPDKLSLRGEVFRVHQLQSDVESDYKYQTVALGQFTYYFTKKIKASLGYKQSFEVKNLKDQSVIASLDIGW